MRAIRRVKHHTTVFDVLNYTALAVLCLLSVYPFWRQLVISTSLTQAFYSDWFHIMPTSFMFDTYRFALSNPHMPRSFIITVGVTVFGTIGGVVLSMFAAYFLSKEYLRLRNLVFRLLAFCSH